MVEVGKSVVHYFGETGQSNNTTYLMLRWLSERAGLDPEFREDPFFAIEALSAARKPVALIPILSGGDSLNIEKPTIDQQVLDVVEAATELDVPVAFVTPPEKAGITPNGADIIVCSEGEFEAVSADPTIETNVGDQVALYLGLITSNSPVHD